jgi:hypothetical protein
MNNPFDFGRSMLETWEKSMADVLERLTRDENFIKNMSSAMAGSLDLKKQLESHLESYLQAVNMPTRTDLERMLSYLQRIEQRLLDLEDRLADGPLMGSTPTTAAPAPGPVRTAPAAQPATPSKASRPPKKAATAAAAKKNAAGAR